MDPLLTSCPGPLPEPAGERSLELLGRAQAGDTQAMNRLVARYQERLLRIARIRLGGRGSGLRRFLESTDVVQETWKAALGALEDLRVQGDADLLNWLARIATNKIADLMDHAQAQRRALDRQEPLNSAADAGPVDPGASPPSVAARSELAELVDEAIAGLAPDHREVIVLRDYCGLDWDAIAARLERPGVHATQQLHQRAWIKVRQVVGPRLRERPA